MRIYQWDNVCQRTKEDGNATFEMNFLDSDLGHAGSIQFDIANTFPCYVHVELDALSRGLVHIYIREAKRNVAKV